MSATRGPAEDAHPSPPWWTAAIEQRWRRVRSHELSRWFSSTSDRTLEPDDLEAAISFGWGAYQAYTPSTIWGPALEQRLGTDWERSERGRAGAWATVAPAVRHGWQRASASSDTERDD